MVAGGVDPGPRQDQPSAEPTGVNAPGYDGL